MSVRSTRLSALVVALCLGHAAVAAPPVPSALAAAEALFQEGRALLMAGHIDEACPKLEESQRLDPATGTLMAVALCQEQQGKYASAWAGFADVEARSRLEGRADRQRAAREHGTALRPRLSTLTLEVPKEMTRARDVSLSIDGSAIGPGAWNVAIPIDGGNHVITSAGGGRTSWKTSVFVQPENDHVRVAVPAPPPGVALSLAPVERPAPVDRADIAASPVASPAVSADGRPAAGDVRRTVGLVLLGAGALGLGTAAILALDARSDYRTAIAHCPNRECPPGPLAQVQDARSQGDFASIVAVGAGVAAVGGAVLWLWGQRGSAGAGPDVVAARVQVLGRTGIAVTGSF